MKRYEITYLREGDPECKELTGHLDADDMIKALRQHRMYWKLRNVEVRHIECRETEIKCFVRSQEE